MRCATAALLVLLALLPARSFAGTALTARQHSLFEKMAENDLSAYLQGGKAEFGDDWSEVAIPWETDQQIGIRYSGGNALSADRFYGQKILFIRGIYLSAENWVNNDYRVQLDLVAAIVNKPGADFLESAKNNTPVYMACKAQGLELDTVYVKECINPATAVSKLARDEVARVMSRLSKRDQFALLAVRLMDEGLSANDPCRTDMTECKDKIDGILANFADRVKKGEITK